MSLQYILAHFYHLFAFLT